MGRVCRTLARCSSPRSRARAVPIDLGPRTGAFPVNQISRDAGFTLHWSGDSRRVLWTMGPELLYAGRDGELSRSWKGRADSASAPEATGTPIGFTTRADAPAGTVALTGARVLTMVANSRSKTPP